METITPDRDATAEGGWEPEDDELAERRAAAREGEEDPEDRGIAPGDDPEDDSADDSASIAERAAEGEADEPEGEPPILGDKQLQLGIPGQRRPSKGEVSLGRASIPADGIFDPNGVVELRVFARFKKDERVPMRDATGKVTDWALRTHLTPLRAERVFRTTDGQEVDGPPVE